MNLETKQALSGVLEFFEWQTWLDEPRKIIEEEFWTLEKTPFDWFEEYQDHHWDMESYEWLVDLYWKLIKEEEDEFLEALKNKDIIEMYDAIADIIFVKAWHDYFYSKYIDVYTDYNNFINGIIEDYSIFDKDCVLECLDEVLRSNFTKSKEQQKEWEKIWKIIKWPAYEAPVLEPILKKYKIIK